MTGCVRRMELSSELDEGGIDALSEGPTTGRARIVQSSLGPLHSVTEPVVGKVPARRALPPRRARDILVVRHGLRGGRWRGNGVTVPRVLTILIGAERPLRGR